MHQPPLAKGCGEGKGGARGVNVRVECPPCQAMAAVEGLAVAYRGTSRLLMPFASLPSSVWRYAPQ